MVKPPGEYTIGELRTIEQVCGQLACSRWTVDRLCRAGKLERVRFGGRTRITARSLRALIDEAPIGYYQQKEKR